MALKMDKDNIQNQCGIYRGGYRIFQALVSLAAFSYIMDMLLFAMLELH